MPKITDRVLRHEKLEDGRLYRVKEIGTEYSTVRCRVSMRIGGITYGLEDLIFADGRVLRRNQVSIIKRMHKK